MARQSKNDTLFQSKSLPELKALHTAITARLNEFIKDENEAQVITYRGLQASIEAHMIKKSLLSEEGYKGYRLEYDECVLEYTLRQHSKYGWDYYGGFTHGNVKSYKSLSRAIIGVLNIINKQEAKQ